MNTETSSQGPYADIVVGIDGSAPSIRALVWALRLASRRDWTLEVVTAWPGADALQIHEVPGHFSAPRHRAFQAQDTALATAREAVAGGSPVRALVVNAHPVEALAARAAGARLVVIGSHGDDTGSHHDRAPVGESVASLVRCPVVVVHDADTGDTSPATGPQEARPEPLPALVHRRWRPGRQPALGSAATGAS